MARPNYGFDKRQREIKKNQKQEEKRLKKLAARATQPDENVGEAHTEAAKPDASGSE